MKQPYPFKVILSILLWLACGPALAYQLLNPGDIAFTSIVTDQGQGQDKFSFVLLTDFESGTVVKFTDDGWNGSSFRADEATQTQLVWTADQFYFAGTEILINGSGLSASHGFTNGVQLNLLNTGDQILAFEGPYSGPLFIAVIDITSAFEASGSVNADDESALPAELSVLGLTFSQPNGDYRGIISGTKPELQNSLVNGSNWIKDPSSLNITFEAVGGERFFLPPNLVSADPANGSVVTTNYMSSPGQIVFTLDEIISPNTSTGNDIVLQRVGGGQSKTYNIGDPEVNISGTDLILDVSANGFSDGVSYEVSIAPRIFEDGVEGNDFKGLDFGTYSFTVSNAGAGGDLLNGTGYGPISSLDVNPARAVFSFTIESYPGGGDIRFSELFINAGPNNEVPFDQVIAGVELFDDNGGSPGDYSGYVIGPASIRFLNISEGSQSTLGRIPTGQFTFTLYIWLRTDPQANIDGKLLEFEVTSANFTYTSGEILNAGQVNSSELGSPVTIDVTATALQFTVGPTDTEENAVMSPALLIDAIDAYANIDRDFIQTIDIVSTGSLVGGLVSQTAVNGQATFSNIVHDAPGTGLTLNASSPGLSAGSNAFNIIDIPANLVNIIPSVDPITDVNAGGSFSLLLDFDQAMDTGTKPSIIFPNEDVSLTLSETGGGWNSNTQYRQDYSVTDANEIIYVTLTEVGGALDLNGTLMNGASIPDLFSIQMGCTPPDFTLSTSPNTACDLAGGSQNGEILVDVTSGGGDYTVTILETSETLSGITSSFIFTGQLPGTYTIQVLDNSNGCAFEQKVIVEDIPSTVSFTATVGNQTACSPVDGYIFVDVVVDGVAASDSDLAVEHFYGTTPDPINSGGVLFGSTTITDLSATVYYIEVTHIPSGCVGGAVVTINDDTIPPDLLLTQTEDTGCTVDNGTISVEIDGGAPLANYSINWHQGADDAGPVIASDVPGLTDLATGFYFVSVTNKLTNCSSGMSSFISETINIPTIDVINVSDNTSCSGGNGSVTIQIDGGATISDYSITWYSGTDNTGPVIGNDVDNISNALAAGSYFIEATSNATGCTGNSVVTVNDVSSGPIVTITSTVDNTTCAGGNGSITVQVDGGASISDYSITWYSGANMTGPVLAADTDFLGSLAGGNYTVVATSLLTGCISVPVIAAINDSPAIPVINAQATANTSCSGGNGSISIADIDGNTDFTPYVATWYAGTDNTGPALASNVFTLGLLATGSYYIEVLNTVSGCMGSTVVDVFDNSTIPFATLIPTPSTSCTGPGNGQIQVDVSMGSGDYTVELYDFGSPPVLLDNQSVVASSFTFADLAEGTYTVIVIDNITGCVADQLSISVLSNPILPTLSITGVTDNTSCNLQLPNGSVTVTFNEPGTYTLYLTGPDVRTLVNRTNSDILNSLIPGNYSIAVENEVTGCISNPVNVIVDDLSQAPTFTTTVSDNTACDAGLATGQISISISGSSSYTLQLSGDATQTITAGSPNESFTGLFGGNYTVSVIDEVSGCTSLPSNLTVSTVPAAVEITLFSKANNTSCASPNGTATISATTGQVPAVVGYSYEWYLFSGGTLGAIIPGETSETISGLTGGSYAVLVTDAETGCQSAPFRVDIADSYTLPTVSGISGGGVTVCGGQQVDLSVTISGGTGPYTVNIDNGVGAVSNYNSNDPIPVFPTATTTYKVIGLTDANGCSPSILPASGTTVNVNQAPTDVTGVSFSNITETSARISWTGGNGAGSLVIMKEGTAVDAAPVSGTAYTHNTVFGTGQDLGNANYAVYNGAAGFITITGITKGTDYFVAVYEYNGTCYSLTGTTGTFRSAGCLAVPDVSASGTDQLCSGETTSISISSTDLNATFEWTVTANGVTGASDGSGAAIAQALSASTTGGGTVTYQITAVNGVCISTPQNFIVTVNPLPQIFNVTGGGIICEGSSGNVNIGLDGSQSGVDYSLLRDGNQVETKTSTGGSFNFTAQSTLGTYTVTAVNTANCTADMSGTASVTQSPLPVLTSAISGDNAICEGESGIIFSIANPDGLVLDWAVPAGFSITAGQGTSEITVTAASGASSGDVEVTASNSCGSSSPVTFAVTVSPGISASIITEAEIFERRETTLEIISSNTLTSVNWSFGDGGSGSGEITTHTYQSAGSFTAEASLTSDDGCTLVVQQLVNVQALAKVSIKNVVTPNGDGANDVLFIEGLDFYPSNEVVFLDRWGVEVKSLTNYVNDWDLTNEGDYVPAGNYLCIVKLPEGDVYSMTVTVIR